MREIFRRRVRPARADRRDDALAGLAAAADGGIHRPFAQQPASSVFVIGRTAGDPLDVAADVRR